MRNRLAALTVLALSSAAAPALADEFPPCGTFVLQGVERDFATIDFEEKGQTIGDELFGEAVLTDSAGNHVGTVRWTATVVDVNKHGTDDDVSLNQMVIALPDGSVNVAGEVYYANNRPADIALPGRGNLWAVIGGTGAYVRSDGEVSYVPGDPPTLELRLICD